MNSVRRILLALCSFVPAIVFAEAPRTFVDLAKQIVSLINAAIPVLVVAAVVIYLYGTTSNLMKSSHGSKEKFRAYMMWGIIILFVMVSIWGILGLLSSTIFPSAYSL